MHLIDSLLTRRVPQSILGTRLPRINGATVDSLDMDEHGYPNDDRVSEIAAIGALQSRRWLLTVFPALVAQIPCAKVDSVASDDGSTTITFTTGGWSGAETLINAVVDNFWLHQYLDSRHKGGRYVFKVL